MANIDTLDATPCPTSTPKPYTQVQLSPSPPGTSDVEMTDDCDFNKAGFKPPSASNSATEDDLVDLVSEEDSVVGSSPPKKLNTKPIKRVEKQRESKVPQVKIMYNSEADESQRPKPKKVKVKVQDEINITN